MSTLETLLQMTVPAKDKGGNDIRITPEFRVAVQHITESGCPRIIIHANGHNSDTLDFVVDGNELIPC